MRATAGDPEQYIRDHLNYQGNGCLWWPYGTNNKGYGLACIGGVQKTASLWMCILVNGEPPEAGMVAAHDCGNGHLGCIHPKHIRWKTHRENMQDKKEHGTEIYGERNGKTKLTEQDVRAIRAAPPHLDLLMKKYGMSKHGISKIRSGKRWVMVR